MHKLDSVLNMDESASTKPDADAKSVFGLFFNIDNAHYAPPPLKQKSTVIKYTKIPDFEFDTKVSWPLHSYTLQPRLRRIITLEDDDLIKTTRSLKPRLPSPPKIMAAKCSTTNRKIVTISEDDEAPPRVAKRVYRQANRSVEADFKEKHSTSRTTSRLSTSTSKYSNQIKTSAKTVSTFNKKEVNVTQQNFRSKQINLTSENVKTKKLKEKDSVRSAKVIPSSKISLSKNFVTSSESDKELSRIKHIYSELTHNLKPNPPPFRKSPDKSKINRTVSLQQKPKTALYKEVQNKRKPITVIHVPLDEKQYTRRRIEDRTTVTVTEYIDKVDSCNDTSEVVLHKDVNIGTDPLPQTVHQITQMDEFEACDKSTDKQSNEESFDNLEIPNVTLTKDKSEPKEESVNLNNCSSLPSLEVPSLKVTPHKEEVNCSDVSLCESGAYVISHATLTYTSKQKFNIQVVGNDDNISPQPPSPLEYPVNVMSVYKKELNNKKLDVDNASSDDSSNKEETRNDYINCLNELESFNCSYMKLMKPSDIISTIRVNNGLLQSDYICEQFQRELNFIDSFFESLQYLERCSLSDKSFLEDSKCDNIVSNSALFDSTFDVRNSEYDNFLSKIENGANIDDTETMASKSLCLLNLLIRDEQRRAKNLLFVLKMREDALKDFTKSQILWLEKKKKHDNTDISTLKKKQRGALLKLQHECGEMQRMRKALLTLSEKRKAALMKTKKNIELKLKNNVGVEQIILGKRKLKRSTSSDRNIAPLKCFDLSSSGCEESTTSRANSEVAVAAASCPETTIAPEVVVESSMSIMSVTSAEKCVQTSVEATVAGSNVGGATLVDSCTDTASECFVTVDGGYLNILFHNLTLPQIFSSGKQYEVNEEALKNIVSSSNNHYNNLGSTHVVDKLMDFIKNKEADKSCSTPSTARSLLDEFDQYYKSLNEDDRPSVPSIASQEHESRSSEEAGVQVDVKFEPLEDQSSTEVSESNSVETCKPNDSSTAEKPSLSMVSVESQCVEEKEPVVPVPPPVVTPAVSPVISPVLSPVVMPVVSSQTPTLTSLVPAPTGPLPVPVGAAANTEPQSTTDVPAFVQTKSSSSSVSDLESVSSQPQSASSLNTLATPAVHIEAEELRRQQLAIEREIKALEQQQCHLLVVREIPDKPPPPYTPPTETRTPKLPKMFRADDKIEEKIGKYVNDCSDVSDESDAFDVFLKDYCTESVERHKQEQSDMPWDSCNLLPQKPQVDTKKVVQKTATDLKEVLTTVSPPSVSGVSSRRSDHIDDILFAEWRRCEPEWTTLHTDEAIVKNQLFESIFQKILNETIDEYKKVVQPNTLSSD